MARSHGEQGAGAGKSQLALDYAQGSRDEYDAQFWVDARNPSTVDKCYREIYQSLCHDPPDSVTTTSDQVRYAVLESFSKTEGRWLMIFDGAGNPDEDDGNDVNLSHYIPRGTAVHIVVTSRQQQTRTLPTFGTVEVGALGFDEAVDLFKRCANLPSTVGENDCAVGSIVTEVGCLALAVSMAGSYISCTPGLSNNLSPYLDELRQERSNLLARYSQRLTGKYDHRGIAVFEASCRAIQRQSPAACRILALLASMDNQDIFPGLFDPETPSKPKGSNIIVSKKEESWARLIGLQEDIEAADIAHLLALLERLEDQQELGTFALAGLRILCDAARALRPYTTNRHAEMRLSTHIRANTAFISQLQKDWAGANNPRPLGELSYLAGFLQQIGSWREASALWRIILDQQRQEFGDDSPTIFETTSYLVNALSMHETVDQSVRLWTDAVERCQSDLGHDHSITVKIRRSLENAVKEQELWSDIQDYHQESMGLLENLLTTLKEAAEGLDAMKEEQQDKVETATKAAEELNWALGSAHPSVVSQQQVLATVLEMEANAAAIHASYETLGRHARIILAQGRHLIAMHRDYEFTDAKSRERYSGRRGDRGEDAEDAGGYATQLGVTATGAS
ncbi:unnamed protein product [Parascedosporium putredinis]|uniref:Kinesin light chain n=1 Tax=Parascedosporium putredinis TaxID=1442378 RepID=A0A9P1H0I4_9PEZI|nr:unnamed protein product [Parascedosporium putredinis]CAI7991813.1 unnamed protein product [Parascedosporium putredinis]